MPVRLPNGANSPQKKPGARLPKDFKSILIQFALEARAGELTTLKIGQYLLPLLDHYRIPSGSPDKWLLLSFHLTVELALLEIPALSKNAGRKLRWSLRELASLKYDIDIVRNSVEAKIPSKRKVSISEAIVKLRKDDPTKYGRIRIKTLENRYSEAKRRRASLLLFALLDSAERYASSTREEISSGGESGSPHCETSNLFGLAELGRRSTASPEK
jgi:hypothetical protein